MIDNLGITASTFAFWKEQNLRWNNHFNHGKNVISNFVEFCSHFCSIVIFEEAKNKLTENIGYEHNTL